MITQRARQCARGGKIVLSDVELDRFATTLEVPAHRQLFDYWRSKLQAGRLPARKDIDPIEIPGLLPWLTLVEVDWSQGSPRFRIRLVGTGVVERLGRDSTGKWFEDVYDADIYNAQMEYYTQVATTGVPSLTQPIPPIREREFIKCRRLVVPLSADGKRVDLIISILIFDDERLRK